MSSRFYRKPPWMKTAAFFTKGLLQEPYEDPTCGTVPSAASVAIGIDLMVRARETRRKLTPAQEISYSEFHCICGVDHLYREHVMPWVVNAKGVFTGMAVPKDEEHAEQLLKALDPQNPCGLIAAASRAKADLLSANLFGERMETRTKDIEHLNDTIRWVELFYIRVRQVLYKREKEAYLQKKNAPPCVVEWVHPLIPTPTKRRNRDE